MACCTSQVCRDGTQNGQAQPAAARGGAQEEIIQGPVATATVATEDEEPTLTEDGYDSSVVVLFCCWLLVFFCMWAS